MFQKIPDKRKQRLRIRARKALHIVSTQRKVRARRHVIASTHG